MRLLKKLQYYNNTFFLYKTYPLSILNSYKEKWKLLIRKLSRKKKKKSWSLKKNRLKNFLKRHIKKRRWTKYKKKYTQALTVKRLFYLTYQKSIGIKFLKKERSNKKNKLRRHYLTSYFIKPLLKADILLNYLRLTDTTYSALQEFSYGRIYINNIISRKTVFLKKGDFCILKAPTVYRQNSLLSVLRQKYKKKKKLILFIEVDYYLRGFIIIKKFNNLKNKEFALLLDEYLPIKNIIK